MGHFSSYEEEKKNILAKTAAIKKSLDALNAMEFDCSESCKKLEEVNKNLENGEVSVVLVGSFSDGKTSVVAGWLGEKLDNMKIDSDESSDQLEIYRPNNLPEKCEIVDTPGLFGSKEKEEGGSRTKFSDITEKYIDQANIILYVVDAKNPVKDSHKETLRWILKDLRKINQTIFVINKMDAVADLTDEDEFKNQAKIKAATLKEKLVDIAGLDSAETEKLKIVCVSSNPNERGFDFWRKHREVYEERSHIADLENATNKVLKETSAQALVTKTGYDVLARVVRDNIKLIGEQIESLVDDVVPKLRETLDRNIEDYESTRKEILKKRGGYVHELQSYEKKLLSKLRAATFENIGDFIKDDIGVSENGECGYKIEQEIQLVAQENFADATEKVRGLCKNIEMQEEKQNEFLDSAMKKSAMLAGGALKSVGKIPVAQMKTAIFAGRDALGKVFGAAIKFKPWGVTKLANNLLKGLPFVGAAIDVILNVAESVGENVKNENFKKTKAQIESLISGIFKSVRDDAMNDENYLAQFAPNLSAIKENLDSNQKLFDRQIERRDKFIEWKKDFDNIAKEVV